MKFPASDFRRAQLGATDVARLFGVSRVTATRWLKGASVHAMAQAAVARRHRAVLSAIAAKALPLPVELRGDQRVKAIIAAAPAR